MKFKDSPKIIGHVLRSVTFVYIFYWDYFAIIRLLNVLFSSKRVLKLISFLFKVLDPVIEIKY